MAIEKSTGDLGEEGGQSLSPIVDIETLLGSYAVLRIRHNGEIYRLRITRNNRLLLTK